MTEHVWDTYPKNIPAKLKNFWKTFLELSHGQAWSYRQTTERRIVGQTDACNDNTPLDLGVDV